MRRVFAWTLTWGAVAGLLIQAPGAALAQQQQAPPAAVKAPLVTIEECQALSDADVRARITELAATSFKTELAAINYPALVNKYWDKVDMSARLDREVDAAIEAVRADSSWVDRAYSTVSKTAAGRYAAAVADKTYNSEGFKAAIEELATGVAKDAGAQIEAATAKVSNPIIHCVQTALQSRYGAAVAQVFAQESQRDVEAKAAQQPSVKIGTADLVLNNAASISGIVLIVTRRVLASVVRSIGSRVVGMVASRIVSAVAGLIGLALIAKDIYDAGDGVFPIIAEHMKSDETKTVIKGEIGKTIQADITQQMASIAQETADRIYAVWQDFKKKYALLLTLSEKSPAFAAILKDARLDQVNRLGQIVVIVKASEGEDSVFKRAADGSLGKALVELNDDGLAIAEERKSLKDGLRWTEVAGQDLPRVVELGLHRWLSPEGLSRETLVKLLAVNDRIALNRIATLEPGERDVMLSLSASQMHDFARKLSDRQLAAFAEYERRLQPEAARALLRAVGESPNVMQALSGEGLRHAIYSSRNQLAALNMVMRSSEGILSYGRIVKDASLVRSGDVGYRVFWERYWPSVILAALGLLLVLSWLRRLFFGWSRASVARRGK